MIRRHKTVEDARAELVRHGYKQIVPAPPAPPTFRWVKKGKPDLAIGRERRARSEVWHIVPYPETVESSSCSS